jgi:uncharacterized damage-inducible protein DinB
MHMHDIINYGDGEIVKATSKLAHDYWDLPNACGVWSVKNIVAHLASYELMLIDSLSLLLDANAPTPTLNDLFRLGDAWNDAEVEKRKQLSPAETYLDYANNFQKSQELLQGLPLELATKSGALAWYGEAYDVEDFLVYAFYGHKREHSAQIHAFVDVLKREGVLS